MKYPTKDQLRIQAQTQQLEERIQTFKKMARMLMAGGVEGCILMINKEIRQLQAMLEELKGEDTDDTTSDQRSP